MKKLTLVILLAFMSIISATAQEADSLQTQHNEISVEDLIAKTNKLQRDFDYLSCDFELTKLEGELNSFNNDIRISSSSILINCYHGSFNYDLYSAYKRNYEALLNKYESLKQKVSSVQRLVILKSMTSNFTDKEIDLISMRCDAFENHFNSIESALDYYKVVLASY